MQNAKSGARRQHQKDRDVLSPVEERGLELKRYVRAAAALNELYEDTDIAEAVGVSRGAIAGWWRGAQPSGETIFKIAEITGLSPDELTRFVYSDGEPPTMPDPAHLPVLEGARRAAARQGRTEPGTPPQPPRRQPRDTGAKRG